LIISNITLIAVNRKTIFQQVKSVGLKAYETETRSCLAGCCGDTVPGEEKEGTASGNKKATKKPRHSGAFPEQGSSIV
jgi:hypothetical protein